jgi:hypothetical protein
VAWGRQREGVVEVALRPSRPFPFEARKSTLAKVRARGVVGPFRELIDRNQYQQARWCGTWCLRRKSRRYAEKSKTAEG